MSTRVSPAWPDWIVTPETRTGPGDADSVAGREAAGVSPGPAGGIALVHRWGPKKKTALKTPMNVRYAFLEQRNPFT
jgi:hypothetical protein